MNVRAQDLAAVRNTGAGLFTFLFRHLYAGAFEGSGSAASHASGPRTFADAEFLRLERLREDLPAYLQRRGVPVTRPMTRFLRDAGPVNASRHEEYPRYYDAGLAALVGARDGDLAERFGYRFARRAGTAGIPGTADAAAVPGMPAVPCLLYTSPSPRDQRGSRMPSSA